MKGMFNVWSRIYKIHVPSNLVDKGKNIGLNFVLLKDHKHKKNDGRKTLKNMYKDKKY